MAKKLIIKNYGNGLNIIIKFVGMFFEKDDRIKNLKI